MNTKSTGTIVDGSIQLDQPIDLPDQSRVTVRTDLLEHDPKLAQEALESFLQRTRVRPVYSDGVRLTRDQLHKRH